MCFCGLSLSTSSGMPRAISSCPVGKQGVAVAVDTANLLRGLAGTEGPGRDGRIGPCWTTQADTSPDWLTRPLSRCSVPRAQSTPWHMRRGATSLSAAARQESCQYMPAGHATKSSPLLMNATLDEHGDPPGGLTSPSWHGPLTMFHPSTRCGGAEGVGAHPGP